MTNQPTPTEQPQPDPLLVEMRAVRAALQSIRGMLQFFVFLTILALVIQGCNVLLSF